MDCVYVAPTSQTAARSHVPVGFKGPNARAEQNNRFQEPGVTYLCVEAAPKRLESVNIADILHQ